MDPAKQPIARERIDTLESRVRDMERRIDAVARKLDAIEARRGRVQTVRTVQTPTYSQHYGNDEKTAKYIYRGNHTWQTTVLDGSHGVIMPGTARAPFIPADVDLILTRADGRIVLHLRRNDGTVYIDSELSNRCAKYYRYGAGREAMADASALLKGME